MINGDNTWGVVLLSVDMVWIVVFFFFHTTVYVYICVCVCIYYICNTKLEWTLGCKGKEYWCWVGKTIVFVERWSYSMLIPLIQWPFIMGSTVLFIHFAVYYMSSTWTSWAQYKILSCLKPSFRRLLTCLVYTTQNQCSCAYLRFVCYCAWIVARYPVMIGRTILFQTNKQ